MSSAKRDHTVGIIFILAAALLWSLNGWLIKVLNDDGRGPGGLVIAFYRSLFAGLFLWPLARGQFHTLGVGRVSKPIADQDHRLHAEGASGKNNTSGRPIALFRPLNVLRPAALASILFFALMTGCFVVANTMTEASNAIILQYTSTFWVFSLSPFILKEKPLVREWPILLLAMGGVAIIFFGEAETDLVGLIVALLAGLFYGLLTMMLRQMRDSHAAAVTVVNNLGAAVLLLPVVLFGDGLAITSNALLLLILMGAAVLGLPYYLFSRGLEHVPAHRAAVVTLAEPVLVPVWAYLALGETVPPVTWLGGGIILFALAVFFGITRAGTTNG